MFNQMGGTKTDTTIKLVLIFFISLLSFSVGTFVGKQVSDSDYKRAALEEDYKSFRNSTHEKNSNEEPDQKLTNEELTSLTEEFVNNEKEKLNEEEKNTREIASSDHSHPQQKQEDTTSEHDKNSHGYKKYNKEQQSTQHNEHNEHQEHQEIQKHQEHQGVHASSAPVSHEAQRVAEGMPPTPERKKVREPNSILPSVGTSTIGKYTIQVASYAAEAEAKAHAAELKQKGWNAFYLPAEISSKTWYRVSVGLFSDQKSAKDFREELMKQSAISTAIIQKIVQ